MTPTKKDRSHFQLEKIKKCKFEPCKALTNQEYQYKIIMLLSNKLKHYRR